MSRLTVLFGPKQLLVLLLISLLLLAGLSLGSYAIPPADLLSRRGTLAYVPLPYRETFVTYRLLVGSGAAGLMILVLSGWLSAEIIARTWQRTRNRELAANAVLLRLAPRVDERAKWEAAAELWAALQAGLARSKREVWLGAGLHFSLEIVQQAGTRLTFYLWTPRPVAELLVRQLRAAYAGLEIELLDPETNDYLTQVSPAATWQWVDLGLARESWRPLRTASAFAVDPLPSLLSALEGLGPGSDLAAVHLLLRPAPPGWARGGQAFIQKLRGDGLKPGSPKPRLGSPERELIKAIELKGQRPGYDLCLRLVVAGSGEVGGQLDRLVQLCDQFGADNRLTVRASGDQTEVYRLQGRYFPAGWRSSVVSPEEVAPLAHLPNQSVTGVALTRARARLERPSPAAFATPGEARLILGRFADVPAFTDQFTPIVYPLAPLRRLLKLSTADQRQTLRASVANDQGPVTSDSAARPVGIKLLDARRHLHLIGPTGVGKSTLLLRLIWQYLDQFPEAAVWLQEPHQDLTHKVIRRVPLWREKEVIWLDVMDPARVMGINPLEISPGSDPGSLVAEVMGVMRKAMGANWETAVQMQEILENALLAVIAGQPQPTLVHLFKLLSDADYRYDLTYRLTDPIAAPYWQSLELKKERELNDMFSVPRRRINAFLRNPVVRRIVAQSLSTLNFRQALDSGKVILVQLDGRMGSSNRTFIGALLMYKLFGAVMSRMDVPESERRQVAIFVDEFQTFIGQSGPEFADILEQARKMGASLTLAHQHLGQLTQGGSDLISSVANNTGTKVVFRAEAADAPQFLKWLPELKSIEDLTTLANYRCYVRPMVDGSPQPVCTLATYPDPPIPDPTAELRQAKRGEPDPLPPHPGQALLKEVEHIRTLSSDEARKDFLQKLPPTDWPGYRAARRYADAVLRNRLIEQPELVPDKLARVRSLVRLGYGTPHYETEALVEGILGQ